MNKFYTAQEIANRLKIKKTTVYDMIKRGELKASKMGKQFRISQEQLDEYLGLQKGTPAVSAIRQMDYLTHTSGLILSSQESAVVDLIRSQTEHMEGSLPILHSYMNDYNSLYSLYYEKTHMALVSTCLSDARERADFCRCFLPGMAVTTLPVCSYQVGLYTLKGNPKGIMSISDLARPDVIIANREKGNCCRIFLDKQLLTKGISTHDILGYKKEVLSHMALADTILSQKADAGLGDAAQLASYPQLECTPLTTAYVYLLFSASYQDHPAFRAVQQALVSDTFRSVIKHFSGYECP